ncbi:MAG: helix-turn-helix domain-containing protein [Nitrososphaerota archaeon]|nr:helix-turn-helix domain-containing protein [Nitrososphaerota archaeon]
MFDVSLRLDHQMPFSNLSKAFPKARIQRWCNLQVDILEIETPVEGESAKAESWLRQAVKKLGAKLIRINRYSPKSFEAVVGCKCAMDNSSVSVIEWAGCIPVMPVNYGDGLEYCRLLAFTKENLNSAITRLSKISKLEITSKSVVPRESAKGAITIPVDEFLGSLTGKQLAAFMSAMQLGYYSLPKRVTMEEVARSQGMKRSTYEEHLRKAELKILQSMRPYARLAYMSAKSK